jgi:F1F0 ATPase subunit 2
VGAALGAVYFAALWATLRGLPTARHPALAVATSWVARAGSAGLVFWAVLAVGGVPHVLAALAGFLGVRQLAVRRAADGLAAEAGPRDGRPGRPGGA